MDIRIEIYKDMIESSERMIALLSLDGDVLYANNSAVETLQSTNEQWSQVKFWECPWFVNEVSKEIASKAFKQALIKSCAHYLIEHCSNEGERSFITFVITPLFDDVAKLIFLMAEATSISHMHVAAESPLIDDAARLSFSHLTESCQGDMSLRGELLLSTLYDTVIFLTPSLTVTEVRTNHNQSLLFISGDIIGHRLSEIFLDTILFEKIRDSIEKCTHPFGVQAFEYYLVHELVHRYYEVCVAYTPINEIVVTFANISDKKQAQARIIELQKMDSIGSLAGGIAHDFNNMLGGIAGYTNLLVTMEDDPHKVEFLQLINKAVKKAAALTQDLLAFGKRAKGHVVQIDIQLMMRQVLSIFKYTTEKRINIESTIEEGLPCFLGDSRQINQVMLNLLQNAAEAITGNGTIAVRANKVECNDALISYFDKKITGTFLLIEISDSGIGIDQAAMPNIFEPFFSTKDTDKIEGRGLGLSTVWGIVNDHGGYIDVISQKGRGTSFMIYFPVA